MDRVRYLIGIATLALAVAGGVFLFNLLGDEDKSRYFRLHLEFRNVEGLLPGADVKYRGVLVGSVRAVSLRDDGEKGIATVVLQPGKETLARTNSEFWIVTPRFGGLAAGASGLETLVRDAYVSFFTPDPFGAQLANGSSAVGRGSPYVDADDSGLEAIERGDLVMTLLVPENHGLVPGSGVTFRGVETGDVRSVDLASDGSHVVVELRIDRRYRQTVTDGTVFWIARPRLSGALLSGFSINDVGAILSPFVGYHSEPGQGLPVPDGHVVAAEPERPSLTLAKIPADRITAADRPAPAPVSREIQVVQVLYEAAEEDWLSPNDEIRRGGTGVLYEDARGRLLVVTARSLCDAGYTEADAFGGDPDIISDGISVVLPDRTVVRALRTWVEGDGGDLALLIVETDPDGRDQIATTPPSYLDFDNVPQPDEELVLRAVDSDRNVVDVRPGEGEGGLPALSGHWGALVLREGRVAGVLGQTAGRDPTPALHPLASIPEALRPPR